ncbi:MAG: sigma-54 dependent transcriptional regulator [Acidobacteriota bacterium]
MSLEHSEDTATIELELAFPPGEGLPESTDGLAVTILYHVDPARVGEYAAFRQGSLKLSRVEPGFQAPTASDLFVRPLGDSYLSRRPLLFGPGEASGSVWVRREGSSIPLTIDGEVLLEGQELPAHALERGVVLNLADRVVLLLHRQPKSPQTHGQTFGMVGESTAMVRLRSEILRSADLDVPVFLQGETGTGKELAARAIHQASSRRDGSFLAVNLGAIPPALAASELFGSVKGAFTGSVKSQPGFFRRAEGGTLFLDEVGEAPPDLQVMLLRVLETGEIQPVGSHQTVQTDVRLITATDADLDAAVRAGSFRAPLLYRLTSGYEIRVPPLRERRDDIGRLLMEFLAEELQALGEEPRRVFGDGFEEPWLPASVVARLASYRWPGNVRELRNVARQLVIHSRDAGRARLGPQVERLLRAGERDAEASAEGPPARPPRAIPRPELKEVLARHGWQPSAAAAELGISRSSLYELVQRYPEIRQAKDLDREEIAAVLAELQGDVTAAAERLEVSAPALSRRMLQLGLK